MLENQKLKKNSYNIKIEPGAYMAEFTRYTGSLPQLGEHCNITEEFYPTLLKDYFHLLDYYHYIILFGSLVYLIMCPDKSLESKIE